MLPIRLFQRLDFSTVTGIRSLLAPRIKQYCAVVDGRRYGSVFGSWAVWIPKLEAKFFHNEGGYVNCRSRRAPAREFVLDGELDVQIGQYTRGEWQAAYRKTVIRRVSEIAICTQRLHRAGLGPELLGFCAASEWVEGGVMRCRNSVGLRMADVTKLPGKRNATEQEIVHAGVIPDPTLSCIRQQTNGYVVDLSSVVGAMPVDAEREVCELEDYLISSLVEEKEIA